MSLHHEAPVLRPMTPADLAEVVAVQRAGAVVGLAAVFPQDLHPFPSDAVRRRWETELADDATDCFVVLGSTGQVVGFAATRADELLHLGTAVETWGTGLAGRVHDDLLDHLRDGGHGHARLTVFERNTRGRRFYLRRGWAETGERTTSTFAPHPVLLTMARALDGRP
ncbi:GNAT family N-acetyltransferase [Oryzobacter telluris]|uniref:GNAT family N-acetyltransferase n=1 Tax=Oryzobacter telluris TaxID=3149179 RepID=UPI00370DBE54